MNRKPRCLPFLLLILYLCTGQAAFAQISTTAQVVGSGQINPGNPFTVQVRLDNSSATSLLGVSYFVALDTSAGSGLFSITGRNVTNSPFSSLITLDGTALAAPSNVLDPISNHDLGGLQPALTPVAPGLGITIADLTIGSLPTLPAGEYVFHLAGNNSGNLDVQVADSDFNSLGAGSPSFSINVVVPEPASLLGLISGCALLASRSVVCRRRGN